MGSVEKQDLRRRRATGARLTRGQREIAQEAAKAGKGLIKDKLLEQRPYLKFAFGNPYNLSLFLGALAAAGITLNPVLALAAIGAEAIWLLHAPDSKRLRKLLWDPRFESLRERIEAEERRIRTLNLPQHLIDRVEALVENRNKIGYLADQNPSFSQSLMKSELVKTDRIVDDFIEMATRSTRYEDYLGSIDIRQLERDRQRWETRTRTGKPGEPETEIAKKNFGVILQRLDKIREIRNFLSVSRGQLDLIENSFKLIADQIVTMQSPGELVGQLDSLLQGVEAIKESTQDTERLLNSLEL